MNNEIQATDGRQESSLPAHLDPELLRLRLGYFSYTALPSTAILAAMTGGQWGESAAVAALLGGAACYWAPQMHKAVGPGLRAMGHVWAYLNRNNSGKTTHHLMDKNWWLYGEVSAPYAEPDEDQIDDPQSEELEETSHSTQETQSSSTCIPAQFVLGRDSLDAIKEANQMRKVYFGRTATRQVVLDIDEMYHVLDVAKSGRGKSNRFRHAMMQVVGLADTYYLNPFAAPVKSVTDDRKIEVWQPIYDRLANKRPMRGSDEILQTLMKLVEEIKRRSDLEQERDFSWREHPIFVFIDEVPEIYARCPDAPSWLDRIGRGGRQFGVFAWIATQSALVKDIGLSTASQAQFKTLIYGGGDKTSGNRVMGYVSPEQENALKRNGAGLTLMIADGLDDTDYVRAPLITNEALFTYLELPPFKIEEWLAPVKSKQPVQDLSQFHSFTPLVEGGVPQAQNTSVSPVKGPSRERRERIKGPNEEAILDALNALEEDEKPLTLNAITKKAGLTWRQAEEIEEAAFWYGYEIERGKGRPTKEG